MKPPTSALVATQSFTGQTAALAATTIFTPSADGTFRVSLVCDNNPSNLTSPGVASLSYTNEYGTSLTVSTPNVGSNSSSEQLTLTVRAKANQPIQVSASVSGPGPYAYDVFVAIEQLD